MKNYIKGGSIGFLVIATGLTSFYLPLRANSIDPKVAVSTAFNQAIETSGEFMRAAVASANTSFKNPLNIFSLKPLQYLQITAPIFKLLPLTPAVPSTSPTSLTTPAANPTKNNIGNLPLISPTKPDLKNVIDQANTPAPTVLPSLLGKTSVPEHAVVNIFCSQKIIANGKVTNQRRIITGSGILIHEDGTVLTNAHVGQFPLLSEKNPNIVCLARYGNPANGTIGMKVAFISTLLRWQR